MKKKLLTLITFFTLSISSFAFTADELCGVYVEHTTGEQALSFLCETYNHVDIYNLVIVSKNSSGKLEFYGFYKSPNAVNGKFLDAEQKIAFSAQKFGGSSNYSFCKAAKDTATVNEDGVITLKNWTISSGSDLYSKEMITTLTPAQTEYTIDGTVTAKGYYTGSATLSYYGENRYLLTEGSAMGYRHYITTDADGKVIFPWATVMYSTDEYCYIYNAMEAEDLLMVGNGAQAKSSLKDSGSSVVISTPFKYYYDYSDESGDNPKDPDAKGTYMAIFQKGATGISAVNASQNVKQNLIYNLQGQRTNRLQRGANIIGGSIRIIQ